MVVRLFLGTINDDITMFLLFPFDMNELFQQQKSN